MKNGTQGTNRAALKPRMYAESAPKIVEHLLEAIEASRSLWNVAEERLDLDELRALGLDCQTAIREIAEDLRAALPARFAVLNTTHPMAQALYLRTVVADSDEWKCAVDALKAKNTDKAA
jgi:hypothetical protein